MFQLHTLVDREELPRCSFLTPGGDVGAVGARSGGTSSSFTPARFTPCSGSTPETIPACDAPPRPARTRPWRSPSAARRSTPAEVVPGVTHARCSRWRVRRGLRGEPADRTHAAPVLEQSADALPVPQARNRRPVQAHALLRRRQLGDDCAAVGNGAGRKPRAWGRSSRQDAARVTSRGLGRGPSEACIGYSTSTAVASRTSYGDIFHFAARSTTPARLRAAALVVQERRDTDDGGSEHEWHRQLEPEQRD